MARSNLAHQLLELRRPHEALVAAREAVETFVPYVLEEETPFRREALVALGHYLRAVEETGSEPDPELLTPFVVRFGPELAAELGD